LEWLRAYPEFQAVAVEFAAGWARFKGTESKDLNRHTHNHREELKHSGL
jgi:hypothetical protein